MDRVLMFLSIIASFAILCQWYVVTRIRKYGLQRYDDISRKTAYTILAVLAVANALCVRIAINSELLPLDTWLGKAAVVVFFSYLGWVLTLSLYFLALGLIYHAFRLMDALSAVLPPSSQQERSVCGERGCVHAGSSVRESSPVLVSSPGSEDRRESDAMEGGASDALSTGPTSNNRQLAPTRRTFLKWTTAAGVVAVSGLAAEGIAQGYSAPVVPHFKIPHPALAGATRPLTFIHVTDFHFGMFLGIEELERLISMANAIEADAVFMTGDMFHSPMTPVEEATPILAKIRPRPLGNFAVLGNHDFYAGVLRSVKSLKDSGWTLLRNEWISFSNGSARIHLGGIDDPMVNWAWGKDFPNFPEFAEQQPQTPGFRLLLSHRPMVLPSAARSGIDLVLAGHIHGGQIVLPVPGMDRGLSIASLTSPYTQGWYQHGQTRMYLSRGCGLTFLPWRVNCPPEITVFHVIAPEKA